MKTKIFKYLIYSFILVIGLQGCRKDSFVGEGMTDEGTTFLKTPDGAEVVHWLSPFEGKKKVPLFNLFKDAHNSTELNTSNTVKVVVKPELIEAYNEEHETDFLPLPADFYTWINTDGVTVTGNDATVQFGNGLLYGDFAIELNGSKWEDLAQRYALAFEITDYGTLKAASSISKTIVVQLGLKNQWDGIYRMASGTMKDASNSAFSHISSNYADFQIQLQTVGETEVVIFDPNFFGTYIYPFYTGSAGSGYGSFAPVFKFDKETNKIVSVTNYYGQPAGNTRSAVIDPDGENYYDPESGTIKVSYFMLQPSVITTSPFIRSTITEEYKFVSSR